MTKSNTDPWTNPDYHSGEFVCPKCNIQYVGWSPLNSLPKCGYCQEELVVVRR